MHKNWMILFFFSLVFLYSCGSSSKKNSKEKEEKEEVIYVDSASFNQNTGEFILDEHTVALWHFNEGRDTFIFDASPHENDGIILGGKWMEKGLLNKSLDLSGSAYVEVENSESMNITRAVTVEGWFFFHEKQVKLPFLIQKATSIRGGGNAAYGLWFNNRGNFHALPSRTLALRITLDGGGEHEINSLVLWKSLIGSWHYIVGTYDGKTARVYVNGSLKAARNLEGQLKQGDYPLIIGKDMSNHNSFNGFVDEIRISKVVRTEKAIASYWKASQRLLGSKL